MIDLGLEFMLNPKPYNLKRTSIPRAQVNDRFEFEEEMDLSGFMAQAEEGETPSMVYKLHSVLVHSGDMHGGHYFSFVRPGCEGDRSHA
jgi:ubiquitin carboxyl-terminal hydrolase 7